jgi:antitoxin (DNA-binding transcriptional repressor) of toxin-antitoxin stability system
MERYAGAGRLSEVPKVIASGQTIEVLSGGKLVACIVSANSSTASRPA